MIVLALLLALMAAAPQRAPELQLNLVAALPPPERPFDPAKFGFSSCGGGGTGAPTTLKVTLADTDRLGDTVGDTMSFSVVLENIGDVPMVLGISRDREVATRGSCSVLAPGVSLHVALVAMNGTRQGAFITEGFGYYGSLDAPGTTAVLQPGERARVQLPAEIRPGPGMDPVLTADPRLVRIKAFVGIERRGLSGAFSDNTLEVELRGPVVRLPDGTRPR
jgi:hypothetical protein